MNGPLIVATAAFLLLLPRFNNADAAGPYDGEWTGTATSTCERYKRAVVKLTVEGQVVLGQARFERDATNINGTVGEEGAVGATIAFQPLRGQFTRDEFEGGLQELQLRMEGSSQAHEVRPLRSKTRSITGTAVHTALAPNRFKDFWREGVGSLPAIRRSLMRWWHDGARVDPILPSVRRRPGWEPAAAEA